eukprot:gene10259-15776_t
MLKTLQGRAPPSGKFAAEVLAEQLKVLNDTIAPADLPYASFAWTDASSVNEGKWKDSQHERFACPDEEPPAIQPDVLFRGNVATFGGKLVGALTQQESGRAPPSDKFAAEVLAEQLKVLNDTIAPADLPYASFAWTDASSVNEDNWKDSQHERFACPDEEPPAIQPDVLFRGNVATFGGKLVDALTQQEAPASGPAAIPPKENRQGCQAHHLRDGELRYADSILVVYRGSCSFHTKAAHAQRAGAAALVIISDRQTAPEMMTDQPGEQSITIPLVLLARADGTELFRRIASAAAGPALQLLLSPQTAGLPLEAHFLGIRAADSPYGLVLWRHERPVPAFLPRDKLHAALAEQVLVPDFSSAAPDHEE